MTVHPFPTRPDPRLAARAAAVAAVADCTDRLAACGLADSEIAAILREMAKEIANDR